MISMSQSLQENHRTSTLCCICPVGFHVQSASMEDLKVKDQGIQESDQMSHPTRKCHLKKADQFGFSKWLRSMKLRPVNWKGQLPGWKLLKWQRNLGVIHNGPTGLGKQNRCITLWPLEDPQPKAPVFHYQFQLQPKHHLAAGQWEGTKCSWHRFISTIVDKYRIDGCCFVFGFGFVCPITIFFRNKGYILAHQRSNIKFFIANDFLSANPNWKLLGLLLILQNVHGRMFLASPQCETSLPQLFQVQYLVFLRLHTTFGCWSTCDF